MFNTELKERFVKTLEETSVRKTYTQFFDIAQKYEEQWGADLCTRTPEEVGQFLSEASGITSQSKASTLSILRKYVRWCLSQEDISDVQESLLTIDSISADKLKSQTVTSPLHLQKYLDAVFDKEDDRTIDNLFRTYLWMAYAGILQENVPKITNEDVDLLNMVIRYNGKEYPIYREAVKAIRYSVELDYVSAVRASTGSFAILHRIDSNMVMRGTKSVMTTQTLQIRVSTKQRAALDSGKTDLRLSYFKVWISGLFYRVYTDELMGTGIKPDFLQYAENIRLASGSKKHVTRQAKYYLEDYLQWKKLLNK